MNATLKLKPLVAAAALAFAASGAFAADAMSRDQVKAEKDRIESQYKADKAACDKLSGNAKDICTESAKGKKNVADAELDAQRSGKPADQAKVAEVRAKADYEVAKEKCDDLSGNAKDTCMKDAKAAETHALSDAKVMKEGRKARAEASEDKREADYKAARERCDTLSGNAKDSCVDAAKKKYDQ